MSTLTVLVYTPQYLPITILSGFRNRKFSRRCCGAELWRLPPILLLWRASTCRESIISQMRPEVLLILTSFSRSNTRHFRVAAGGIIDHRSMHIETTLGQKPTIWCHMCGRKKRTACYFVTYPQMTLTPSLHCARHSAPVSVPIRMNGDVWTAAGACELRKGWISPGSW